ncbi:polysaccharide biosynthesis C-terminal domain-containing protein [Spongiibacter tropicus]|uniref:polysaccharide biosynthesis C-terminal domain-containing protein n=1 Tax=Spongiibacter tropicus TaxID=454602 RepID=UPI0035BE896B
MSVYNWLLARREILLASLTSLLYRSIAACAAFVSTLFIARALGAEQSGYFFLAFSLVSIFATVSRIGMDYTVIRFVGAEPGQACSVLTKVLIASSVVSFPVSIGLYFFANLIASELFEKPELAESLRMISFGVVGLALFTLTANALQGLRKVSVSIFILNICMHFLLVSAVYLGVTKDAGSLSGFYSIAALANAMLGIGLFLWFRPKKYLHEIPWKMIWGSCLPLWAVTVMGQMVQWSGQFIAGAYVNSGLVAQLAVAQRTAMLASFVLIAVNLVVAPRFAALHRQGDMSGLQSLAITSVKLIGVMALPVVGMMLVFPSWLMGLFGESFDDGASLLQILAIGQFLNAITGSVGSLLMMSGHERDLRNVTLISGFTALFLTWLLTIGFGAQGNAVGTAVAVATQNLLAVYFVKKRLGFNTLAVWR